MFLNKNTKLKCTHKSTHLGKLKIRKECLIKF